MKESNKIFCCPYCYDENIERINNEELFICFKCHKWFYDDDVKEVEE